MPFLLANWRWVLIGSLILSTGLFFKLWREDVRAFTAYKIEVAALGKAAEMEKARIEESNKLNKERTDAENQRTLDTLRADVKRLRLARAGRSFLPAATATAKSPDRACFDRAELESAIRDFDRGVASLIDEGDEARVNLDTAKKWAAAFFVSR